MAEESLISDELLRQLMAVGHVDVLVGIPTLNNAASVQGVVRTVQRAFDTYFPRDRTVLLNSDGGSTDGTPALVRDASIDTAGTFTVSHGLRTTHRISTPYHGVPGKGTALRQILTAAELSQAKAVAVLDADVTSITPEWIAALIHPVRDQRFDYVAPAYRRHPLEGPLISQMLRPLVRATYGWQLQEPLAAEFGCSGRFLAACLEQDVWDDEFARYGIDLWITGEALSAGFRCCQAPLGPRVQAAQVGRPGFPEVFQQVAGSMFGCLERHAAYWLSRTGSEPLPLVGTGGDVSNEPPHVDGTRLTQSFCADLTNLQTVLASILSPDTLATLNSVGQGDCDELRFPDALWVATVNDFLVAYHRGMMRRDHIIQALVPLYLGRAGSFLIEYATANPADADRALESLCMEFERSKPELIARWQQTRSR